MANPNNIPLIIKKHPPPPKKCLVDGGQSRHPWCLPPNIKTCFLRKTGKEFRKQTETSFRKLVLPRSPWDNPSQKTKRSPVGCPGKIAQLVLGMFHPIHQWSKPKPSKIQWSTYPPINIQQTMEKSPFFMGKSTISMVIFNRKLLVYRLPEGNSIGDSLIILPIMLDNM